MLIRWCTMNFQIFFENYSNLFSTKKVKYSINNTSTNTSYVGLMFSFYRLILSLVGLLEINEI